MLPHKNPYLMLFVSYWSPNDISVIEWWQWLPCKVPPAHLPNTAGWCIAGVKCLVHGHTDTFLNPSHCNRKHLQEELLPVPPVQRWTDITIIMFNLSKKVFFHLWTSVVWILQQCSIHLARYKGLINITAHKNKPKILIWFVFFSL